MPSNASTALPDCKVEASPKLSRLLTLTRIVAAVTRIWTRRWHQRVGGVLGSRRRRLQVELLWGEGSPAAQEGSPAAQEGSSAAPVWSPMW